MPVTKLQLAETPFGGDKDRRTHKFILEATGMTEEQVYDFLLANETGTFPGGLAVERPDGTLVTTGFPILTTYDDRVIDNIAYTHRRDCDPEIYEITATYQNPQSSTTGVGVQTGIAGIRFSFETGPENEVIKRSLLTVGTYPPTTGGLPPKTYGSINLQPDGSVEGVQVPEAASRFSIEYTEAFGWFTPARRMNIGRMQGKVNSSTLNFGGVTYSAGEVRFLGAAGEITSAGNSSLTLEFGVRENQTGITIVGVEESTGVDENGAAVTSPIRLDGWDYLWLAYGRGVENDKVSQKIEGAFVERILRRADLNGLFT